MAKRTKAQENSILLDPNRAKIAKQNAVLPGGPANNNPMNVTSIKDGVVSSESIYGDYKQQYSQMGAGIINPQGVGPSGLQQNFPKAQFGYNQTPYGMQNQPDGSGNSPAWEMMEGGRLASYGKAQKLPTAPMGLIGGPPIPGALPGAMRGTSGPDLLPGHAAIVPGSTPQKIGQKKKGGKK
jgi:hypothetical protein